MSADVMEAPEHPSAGDARRSRSLSGRSVRLIAVVAAIVLASSGVLIWRSGGPAARSVTAGTHAVTADDLEQRFGARIELVGLLAAGGLVELRFQVIDKDKAAALFGTSEEAPRLAIEGTSSALRSAEGMGHKLTLLDGASYFFLYSNPGNQVHAGTKVSFVMNDVRLEHLVVQK